MTITLSIHNQHGKIMWGSLPLEAFAKLVQCYQTDGPKSPVGFIQTEEGKTTVGVIWKLRPGEVFDAVGLQQLLAVRGGHVLVRTVQMGSVWIAVVNMLLPQTNLMWLADVFAGFVSNAWLMEMTVGWDERGSNLAQYPPRIVTLNPQPFILLPAGMITAYYDRQSDKATQEYGADHRGYELAEQHRRLVGSASEMVDVEFAEHLAQSGFDGLVQMTDNRFTGLHHCCTVIYPDGRDVRVVHLRKESNAHPFRYVVDDRDNELVITWKPTGDMLFDSQRGIWPFPFVGEPRLIDDVPRISSNGSLCQVLTHPLTLYCQGVLFYLFGALVRNSHFHPFSLLEFKFGIITSCTCFLPKGVILISPAALT